MGVGGASGPARNEGMGVGATILALMPADGRLRERGGWETLDGGPRGAAVEDPGRRRAGHGRVKRGGAGRTGGKLARGRRGRQRRSRQSGSERQSREKDEDARHRRIMASASEACQGEPE